MNGIVTPQYMRQRFWIATLVVLSTFAISASFMIRSVGEQADRHNYMFAFDHLNNAALRLERELARLSLVPDNEVVDRQNARVSFVALLTEFSAVSASGSDESEISALRSADSLAYHHLTELAAAFGVDTASAVARRRIGAGSMPEAIEEIWEREDPAARTVALLALEPALARLLRLTAPLVQDEGRLSSAERHRLREIEALTYGNIQPLLTRAMETLDAEGNRIINTSVIFILALTGIGVAAALLNFFAIFWPLTNTVMANQAEIISERDKAKAAHQAKQDFLSTVTHELRTPMNGVLGFASLLIASDLKPNHRKQVEIIQSSGKALLALVNDILDFSKMEAGSLELADENFSIQEVISDVVTLLHGAADQKQLELIVNFDPRLPGKSHGDGNRLRQVLTNLVGNAIKFTDSGRIVIDALAVSGSPDAAGGCELKLAISDTGIGVPVDKREAIFERFTQIDRSARRKFEGTGLGLSICQQIVEKMGGRIWVESTLEIGSTFFVQIPLEASLPTASLPAASLPAAAECAAAALRVVVENPVNQDTLLAAHGAAEGPGERAGSRQ